MEKMNCAFLIGCRMDDSAQARKSHRLNWLSSAYQREYLFLWGRSDSRVDSKYIKKARVYIVGDGNGCIRSGIQRSSRNDFESMYTIPPVLCDIVDIH